MVTAYGLLLTLGYVGAHRFYLGRPASGILITAITALSLALLWAGYTKDAEKSLYAGAILGAGVVSFMLVDLFMIPGIIEAREKREKEVKVSPMMGNLDPSFQATMRAAREGREDDQNAPRRSALPEDFERPWHRREPVETMVYSPSAETGAAVQAGIPAHAMPAGAPPRPDRLPYDLGYAEHTPKRRRRAGGPDEA